MIRQACCTLNVLSEMYNMNGSRLLLMGLGGNDDRSVNGTRKSTPNCQQIRATPGLQAAHTQRTLEYLPEHAAGCIDRPRRRGP